ncbi:MAG: hypothetical protein PUD80_02390 [Firmicutes bacterium]|nr:hypothetical protein [Bacillota bacterium]
MEQKKLYCAGGTAAARYAADYLRDFCVPTADRPGSDVGAVLLDVPSFGPDGKLRMGGSIENLLAQLPPDVTICGGNLDHPALEGCRTVDFLKDARYLAENAYITAECAVEIALSYLAVTLRNCPVLIIGWGRIGKCLVHILHNLGANVTVAARKETDRAICCALGCEALDTAQVEPSLGRYRLIVNTVPWKLLSGDQLAQCHPDCVKIDLASKPGMEGESVITARGLPGIHMPESSGRLIAETFVRLCGEEW